MPAVSGNLVDKVRFCAELVLDHLVLGDVDSLEIQFCCICRIGTMQTPRMGDAENYVDA